MNMFDWLKKLPIEWKTGIFPLEMLAFIWRCEIAEVNTIIESGRGLDGYSTQVLGEYAKLTGKKVVSIDIYSPDPKFKDSPVSFMIGDAFKVFPRAMKNKGPFAILLDGPKNIEAINLSRTAAHREDVRLVAHHNVHRGTPVEKEFRKHFPLAHYYESAWGMDPAKKKWEADKVKNGNHNGRSLEWGESSLILAPVANKPAPSPWLFMKWWFQ